MPILPAGLATIALALAMLMRPWRMLADTRLAAPLLATLVLLPWIWALPALHPMPLSLRWSGACLVLLLLGWPLAVPVLLAVALLAGLIGGMDVAGTLDLALWQGLLPATFALGVGYAVRRWLPRNPFVYIFCRGFFATLLCLFASQLMAARAQAPAAELHGQAATVAAWLMAWGDAVLTGMLTAVFVAFRPQWLATWSDHHYLPRP